MSKSNFLNNKKLTRSDIALICILAMMAGFLVSRVVLSVAMMAFGVNALWGIHPRRWLQHKWWLVGMLWVAIYALTWFWSTDKGSWNDHFQVKLPIMLLPLCFSFLPSFSVRQLQVFTVAVGLMLAAAAVYSMSFMVLQPAYYIRQYKQSHLLPTLAKNDHIRVSMAMVLFIVWLVYIWPFFRGRAARAVTIGTSAVIIVFLHVLAAKTGLVSLYLFIVCWAVYLAVVRRKIIAIFIIAAIPLFIFLGIRLFPTFRERANYIGFTYDLYKRGQISGQYGDYARIISYKLAARLIGQHPVAGVGTGNMMAAMDSAYAAGYPQAPLNARILPHNQFLVVALGCGIPAASIFAVWVFMPLGWIKRNRQGYFFFFVWLILFLQLLIEPVLEVQFGVFVYLFFLLVQRHELDAAVYRLQIRKPSAGR